VAAENAHHSIEGSDTHADHERPEDWGWHHEFATGRQVAGWITFLVLGLMLTSTHYNNAGTFAILLMMAVLAGGLIWDRHRRRTQWRS
jgi:drug/metabolite transporter (DMT)-like permease